MYFLASVMYAIASSNITKSQVIEAMTNPNSASEILSEMAKNQDGDICYNQSYAGSGIDKVRNVVISYGFPTTSSFRKALNENSNKRVKKILNEQQLRRLIRKMLIR